MIYVIHSAIILLGVALGIYFHVVLVRLFSETCRGLLGMAFHFLVFPGVIFCFLYYFGLVLPSSVRTANAVRELLTWITG